VAGRPLELVIEDDLGTPEGARAADRRLLEAGVVAIIGHPTSTQTIAGLGVTEPAGRVMISPTASSPALSGKKDHFFRLVQSTAVEARQLARRVLEGRKITRLAAVHDADNAAYSGTYLDAFADAYRALGGELVARAEFSSRAQPDLAPLLARLRAAEPAGLLVVAADVDTALIAQRTRLMGWPVPLFAAAWAQTETLINDGGRAVEGLEIELIRAALGSERVPFTESYQSRFGQPASFGAVNAYEAAQVLAAALQRTRGRAEGLATALAGIKDFQGVTDRFSFDEYGDAQHSIRLGVIRERRYVAIDGAR
jgi:branched-chain amino acid transport system substrate-binding protein